MRYIYKCIRCEKDIEEVQGTFNETLRIEGAMCRDCCRTSVNQFYERTMIGFMKKLHWTQTPEGKKRMSAIRKKQWKTIRKGKKRTDEEFEDESLSVRGDARMADLLSVKKRKPQSKRPKVDAVKLVNSEGISIKDLLESLFEQAEATQEAARQIAEKLGLEL